MKTLVVALMLSTAAAAGAQDVSCANASSQATLNQCAGLAAKKSDAALNRIYSVVRARLSPAAKVRLRDAQRAWLSFRDKQCNFESSGPDGGSVSPMIANSCFSAVTDERIKALTAFRTCEEGDLSCPR